VLLVGRAFPDSQSRLNCWKHPDIFQSALLVFFIGLTDKMESLGITMKRVHPSAHPGYTDFWCGEGFVVRLCEQVLEVQFLYIGVGCFLQNGPVTVLSQCSSYTTKRSSYCIVTVHFLYYKTVQLVHCHSAVPILQNGPVTVLSQCSSFTTNGPVSALSQCSSYTTKRSSYCIVTVQFLYYKTVQLVHCHSAVPILQNGLVSVLSQCSS